jgi:predicted nucleotidyltransferase
MKKYKDFIVEKKVSYKKELCEDIWTGDKLVPRIEEKLLLISKNFYKELELGIEIIDIILTGSLANYNYTASSDIDLHIIIDFSEINEDTELVKKALDGQRFIWNTRHNIVIKGHDVELYVQDNSEEHTATGQYSILNKKWIKFPTYNPPNVDTKDVDVKYDALKFDIDELEKLSEEDLDVYELEQYYNKSKDLKNKIMKSRKDGLSKSGEFSIENLVFKKLRNEGKIEKLINITNNMYDKIFSQ